ncbi:hypothetical protein [Campylobacter rectus]|nr:hypothetical protein [Campylobacter rectus]
MRARIGQDKIYARRDEGGESAKVGLFYRKFEPLLPSKAKRLYK